MNNPYTPGGAIVDSTMFFGRGVELDEILQYLRGSQSISIVGPPEIGKSSLLKKAALAGAGTASGAGMGRIFVLIGCQDLACIGMREILSTICMETATALTREGLESEPALSGSTPERMWSDFETVFRKMHQRGLKPVLMLDDFEWLSNNAQVEARFYNALRSIASRLGVAILTCSQRPLIELTFLGRSQEILSSPFFNIFAQLNLGLLTEAEARQLIREPLLLAGRPADPTLEEFILQLVGRHPLGLQTACFHAWEQSDDLVEIERLTRQALAPFFQDNWEALGCMEREALLIPAHNGLSALEDPVQRIALRDLTRKCLVVPTGGTYTYPSKVWAEFVLSKLPLST